MNKTSSFTRIEISKENLLHNFSYLGSLNKKISVAPVLKSNAYGRGLIYIAKILDPLYPPFFCVNSFNEAIQLYEAHIKTPILIMGYFDPAQLEFHDQFSFAVYSKEQLHLFVRYFPLAKLHLFIDTGMHREGILIEDIKDIVTFIKKNHMNIEGLMSHFACGDTPECELTSKQLGDFKLAKKICYEYGIKPKWEHIAASSALLRQDKYPDLGNMARTGLALYGFDPGGMKTPLKPILKLITKFVQIKQIKKGEKVGYGGTFRAEKDMKIGILPLGYNDGLDRRLSNKGYVTINKIPCKIAGRVSMNITTIDISHVIHPRIGKDVMVYSDNSDDVNSIENSAKLCKTIPHDILVGLNPNFSRYLINSDIISL